MLGWVVLNCKKKVCQNFAIFEPKFSFHFLAYFLLKVLCWVGLVIIAKKKVCQNFAIFKPKFSFHFLTVFFILEVFSWVGLGYNCKKKVCQNFAIFEPKFSFHFLTVFVLFYKFFLGLGYVIIAKKKCAKILPFSSQNLVFIF